MINEVFIFMKNLVNIKKRAKKQFLQKLKNCITKTTQRSR